MVATQFGAAGLEMLLPLKHSGTLTPLSQRGRCLHTMAKIRNPFAGMLAGIKKWYERNFTWKGFALFIFFLAKEIPDDFGRNDFWRTKMPGIWQFVSAHSTIFIVLFVGLLIWLDHRAVLRRRAQVHDDKTLNGRTRALCEELQVFRKELGKEPQIVYESGFSPADFTEANQALSLRGQKMHHGFHLRYWENAIQLWHEHGAEMRESQPLYGALSGRIDTDERLDAIIKMFSELVAMNEASRISMRPMCQFLCQFQLYLGGHSRTLADDRRGCKWRILFGQKTDCERGALASANGPWGYATQFIVGFLRFLSREGCRASQHTSWGPPVKTTGTQKARPTIRGGLRLRSR